MNELHRDAIVIVGHSDIVASDVDWRRESGERKVLEKRHLPTLRKGGVTVICDHIGGDAPYGDSCGLWIIRMRKLSNRTN